MLSCRLFRKLKNSSALSLLSNILKVSSTYLTKRRTEPAFRQPFFFKVAHENVSQNVASHADVLSQNGPSFSFADWAKTYKHNNGLMCSLDVTSLFTNVLLDETIRICLDRLYSLPDPPQLITSFCFERSITVCH